MWNALCRKRLKLQESAKEVKGQKIGGKCGQDVKNNEVRRFQNGVCT